MEQRVKFKEAEIGKIPEDWEIKTLGDVSVNFDNKRIPLSSRERNKRKGIYPYYGAQGIIDYIDAYIFDGEFLLIAEDGENLKSRKNGIAFIAKGKFWVNNHAHIIKNTSKSNLGYLCYQINYTDITSYITGSAQPKLNQKSLNEIIIKLPSIDEQNYITAVLSSLDSKIKLNQQMNKTLETIGQAIFKRWFIDFEFPNEEGKPYKSSGGEMADSELGEIPKGWIINIIGDIVTVKGGATPSTKVPSYWEGGTINWCTPKDLSMISVPVLIDTDRKITKEGLATISSGLLPKGTLLLSSRAPIGYLAISSIPISINQGFIGILCDRNVSNFYMLGWIKQNLEIIKNMANGSTFQEINKSSFKQIPIVVPPKEIIQPFDVIMDQLYSKVLLNEKQSKILSEIRDSLLPKLMSGKIRVKVTG